MAIRPVTPIERFHCYNQSETLQTVTAFIGVFFADFGCDGAEYRSHFTNYAGREKTKHFSQDLEKTIQMMKDSSECGRFLSGSQAMQNFCMPCLHKPSTFDPLLLWPPAAEVRPRIRPFR